MFSPHFIYLFCVYYKNSGTKQANKSKNVCLMNNVGHSMDRVLIEIDTKPSYQKLKIPHVAAQLIELTI